MLLLFTKFSKCNKIIMTLIRSRSSIIHLFCRFGSSMQIIGSAVWDSRVAGPRIIGGTPLTGPHISHSGLVPKIAHLWFRAKLGLPLQNMKPVIDHEFCKKKKSYYSFAAVARRLLKTSLEILPMSWKTNRKVLMPLTHITVFKNHQKCLISKTLPNNFLNFFFKTKRCLLCSHC